LKDTLTGIYNRRYINEKLPVDFINAALSDQSLQVGVPDTVTNELKSLILAGKKIEAIKKYRTVTGLGLLEAKEYVDSLCEQELK